VGFLRVRDNILEQLEKTAYESSKYNLSSRKEKWASHPSAEAKV